MQPALTGIESGRKHIEAIEYSHRNITMLGHQASDW